MRRRVTLALVILTLVMTGCQAGTAKDRKVLPEWSRGQQVGLAGLNQPIHLVAADGQVHMIWVTVGAKDLHYVRLDGAGQIRVDTDLSIGGAHASDPRLTVHADGSFDALWTDNPNIPRALFLATFDAAGQLVRGPTQLSPDGARVAGYAVAQREDGGQEIFWADDVPTDGGIHQLRLAEDGQVASADRLLVPSAESPTLQVTADGRIHLAWVEEPSARDNRVYYAVFEPSTDELGEATRVASYRTATGLVSYPPSLGLDEDRAYLFWALEQRGGGLASGEASTYFVSFPVGHPQPGEPAELDIPGTAKPSYASAAGSLPYQRLAPIDGWPSNLSYMPMPLNAQNKETGVFLVVEVATSNRTSREVVWAIFEDGVLKGYQIPTKADTAMRPRAVLDEDGNVHLAWLTAGGFSRYEVYYASTSGTVKASLDRVTLQDLAMDFLNGAWNLAPAIGFFPPVFMLWSFASFFWVIAFYFVKVEGGMERRTSQVAFGVAVLLYLGCKLFLMPSVLFYAPFLDRLPPNLQFIPVIGTPIFTLLVALGAVWLYYRRREYRSLFATYLIFVMTDALLSLIIYVPRWLEG